MASLFKTMTPHIDPIRHVAQGGSVKEVLDPIGQSIKKKRNAAALAAARPAPPTATVMSAAGEQQTLG